MHKIITILVLCGMTYSASTQSNGNSPYSRFGIGDLLPSSFMNVRQMGYISTSYANPYFINMDNPASYAFLNGATFDLGISAKRSLLNEGDVSSDKIWSGNLDYLALAFPLQNDLNQILDREVRPHRFGLGFSLIPSSNVSYNISNTIDDPTNGQVINTYKGEGGSYKFLIGSGFKYKNLAVGVNFGSQFGKISYQRSVNFVDLPGAFKNKFTTDYTISGLLANFGILYTLILNKKEIEQKNKLPNSLTIGFTYQLGTNITTTSDIVNIAEQYLNPGIISVDTGYIVLDKKAKAFIPPRLGLGLCFRKGKSLMLGIDFKKSYWGNYYNEATQEVKETLKNTTSMSFGGYFRPNFKSFSSYWQRVYYRFGFFRNKENVAINNSQLISRGFTFGLGLPFNFQRKISHANIGIEIGKRGNNYIIKESYIILSLGFTFTDNEWFLKRKYN